MLSNNAYWLMSMQHAQGVLLFFSTGGKFRPVSNFLQLHVLTLAACSYALLLKYFQKLTITKSTNPILKQHCYTGILKWRKNFHSHVKYTVELHFIWLWNVLCITFHMLRYGVNLSLRFSWPLLYLNLFGRGGESFPQPPLTTRLKPACATPWPQTRG